MSTYVSEDTDQVVTIMCRYAETGLMYCGDDKTAVALRGQWEGGNPDVNPVWVPVCAEHDHWWDVDHDTQTVKPVQYRLPRFEFRIDDA